MTLTIRQAIVTYLHTVEQARSSNTARTYANALDTLCQVLANKKIDPDTVTVTDLNEDVISWLIASLREYSPATERLYLTAATNFFEYLAAENFGTYNLARVRLLIRQRARKPGQRLPQFPREAIEAALDYAQSLALSPVEDDNNRLRNLRDRAFLLTLADTGLRVHEACNLRRGDIDWNENRALIIGKGDKQAVVRFSKRSLEALKDYLTARAQLDGKSGKPLTSLPVFARHDRGAGKKVKPITTATGRDIVTQRVTEAIGGGAAGAITPHSFRHYFVTTVLLGSGGNIKLAQELARHTNIAVTQRYAHLSDDELDMGYYEIFNEKGPS